MRKSEKKQVVTGQDGVPSTIEQSIPSASVTAPKPVAKIASDPKAILAKIAPSSAVIVEPKEINVDGVPAIFNIKRLSYAACSKVDSKKNRRTASGGTEYNHEYAITVGLAWHIHSCVVRDDNEGKSNPETGESLSPNWLPMFTLEDVLGESLMGNPDPKARGFVYELLNAVWEVNPDISPLNQAAAASQIGAR